MKEMNCARYTGTLLDPLFCHQSYCQQVASFKNKPQISQIAQQFAI
jgi:hypothetical protein